MTKKTESKQSEFRKLPAVDILLGQTGIQELIAEYGHEPVASGIRRVLQETRASISGGSEVPDTKRIEERISSWMSSVSEPSLKKVLNATGVIIHTNLGRAPLGKKAVQVPTNGYVLAIGV